MFSRSSTLDSSSAMRCLGSWVDRNVREVFICSVFCVSVDAAVTFRSSWDASISSTSMMHTELLCGMGVSVLSSVVDANEDSSSFGGWAGEVLLLPF